MPIVYEPPQPFAPGISSGYGAAQQSVQDLPLIQNAQAMSDANRRAELGAVQQSNALAAQAGQANADRQSREAAQGAGLREQAYQFDESRRPSARDQFFADQQFNQTAQRFALHAQMQDQELSQAETMRLQRLQQAKGTIQQQVDEGYLSPEEGNSLMLQAQTGINPLQQRLAKSKAMLEESQNQKLMDDHAKAMIHENEAKKFYAKTFSERVAVWNDPETGKPIHFYEKAPGQWEPVKNPEVAQEKQAKEAANLDAIRFKDYSRAAERIEASVQRWAEQRDKKDEAKAKEQGRAPDPLTPDQIETNRIDAMKRAGLEDTWEAQRAKFSGIDAAQGKPVTVTGSGQIPTAAGPAQPQKLAELTKPFDEDAKASPLQQSQIGTWKQQNEDVQKLPIPPQAKQAYSSAITTLDGLLREYGSVADPSKMSDADRAAWQLAVDKKAEIERMKFGGPGGPNWLQRRMQNYQPAPGGGGGF